MYSEPAVTGELSRLSELDFELHRIKVIAGSVEAEVVSANLIECAEKVV